MLDVGKEEGAGNVDWRGRGKVLVEWVLLSVVDVSGECGMRWRVDKF